jgi:hypothetical protein
LGLRGWGPTSFAVQLCFKLHGPLAIDNVSCQSVMEKPFLAIDNVSCQSVMEKPFQKP